MNATLDTRFGDGVAISSDGLRIAIGASGHDDPAGTASGAGGNGGLFVYNFNTTSAAWVQSASYIGNVGEGLGLRFAMSSDGSRLVLRRNPHTANSTVEVYNTMTKARVGNTITGCPFEADAISISPDGNRLAVSCEKFTTTGSPSLANAGKVDLYQWNATSLLWVPLGTIQGGFAQALFSYATAFDTSGSRLAVSAVLFDGSATRPGAVFVYQRNTTSAAWDQIGARLTGGLNLDRFGSAVSLSDDGSTIVVGAQTSKPTTSTTFDGFVAVFKLVNSAWVAKGQVLLGQAGETFGRSVAISADGSRVAASAALANNEAGSVRLYEYQSGSSTWVQVNGDIEGLAAGDRLGYGQKGIALTGNGFRIVVGASLGDNGAIQTGYARVFDTFLTPSTSPSSVPSKSPSASPSKAPSKSPSTSPSTLPSKSPSTLPSRSPSITPSAFLSATSSPSITAIAEFDNPSSMPSSPMPTSTITPTVLRGKFDWDLERVGPVTVVFTDASEGEDIKMTYSISHRTTIVKIFDVTCQNLVVPGIVVVSQKTKITSPTHSLLSVNLDINEQSVVTSSIWKDGETTGEGFIELCVRVDLVLDDAAQTSVNFHEQKLYLSIGLSQGFAISQIDIDRDEADKKNQDAQVDFGITSCHCNATRGCVNDVLVQGDDVFICVFTPADSDIVISAVEELDFIQGSFSVAAVNNSMTDALTAVSLLGKTAVIRTQLRSEFFDATNPSNMTAMGKVSVRFGNSTRRNLRIGTGSSVNYNGDIRSRMMQGQVQEEKAGFAVNMALAPRDLSDNTKSGVNAGALIGGLVGGFAGVAIIVALLLARRRKKDDEDDEPLDS